MFMEATILTVFKFLYKITIVSSKCISPIQKYPDSFLFFLSIKMEHTFIKQMQPVKYKL